MPRYAAGSTSQGVFSVNVTPVSNDGAALGTTSLRWSDLFLAIGGVINFGGGTTLTDGTSILTLAGGALVLPSGVVTALPLGIGSATAGFYSPSSNTIAIAFADTQYHNWGGGAYKNLTGTIYFGTSDDLVLNREGANILQQGDDAASPLAQTFKGPDARAGTDTDTVGGRINWRTGLSTGNAVPAVQSLQGGAATVTTGTGAQTVVDRFIPNAFKVLTDGSAIAVLNVTVANNTMTGGKIVYCIEATDGTDYQSETGEVFYATQNDGSAVVGAIAEANTQQAISAGGSTLASTWAMTDANPAVISINANTSLTPSTGFPRITFSIQNLGQQAIAIQ